MTRRGSCHCGKIAFSIAADPTEANECNCSHCSRKGYLLAFLPRDALTLETPAEEMATYRFHKHVIAHHFCPTCGCAPFAEGKAPDGSAMAAVNLRCLEDFDLSKLTIRQVDGRSF